MPSVIENGQCQTAVYWAPSPDGFDASGSPLFVTPGVEVACRWKDDAKEVIAANGTTFMQSAEVHPATAFERGGFAVEGTLLTIADANDPEASGAHEVIMTSTTPNFRDDLDNITALVGQKI